MAAAVDADHTVAALDEKQHLRIPVIGAEWPAVTKDNWLPPAPVIVVNFSTVL